MAKYNGGVFYQTRHFNIFLTASVSGCTWDAALRRWERESRGRYTERKRKRRFWKEGTERYRNLDVYL